MNENDQTSADQEKRENTWAPPTTTLNPTGVPNGAINLNVKGRHLTGPLHGFGQLWQKTYRVRLSGLSITPAEVIREWKANFPSFWPKGNYFYAPLTGIQPGDVAVLNLSLLGLSRPVLSTGIMVIYADEESFSFMSPEGHPVAGLITFSAFEEDGATVAQVEVLVRANDPIYELGMRLGVQNEDTFWEYTIKSVAAHFGIEGQVQTRIVLLDPKVQWPEAKNIWHNAAIRTVLYIALTPIRGIRRIFQPEGNHANR